MQSRTGHLADDGERVQCHVCGKWYRALVAHLARAHDMSTEQYRETYGLPRTQSLTSASSAALRRKIGQWRRDNDPSVMAALDGDKARAQRAEPFPSTRRRQASAERMADGKRRAARGRLDDILTEAGFTDLADAAAWAASLDLGWAGLAAALGGVNHSWLAEVGAERGATLTAPPSGAARVSRRYLDSARRYVDVYGHLDVPSAWMDGGGDRLGRWLVVRRHLAREGRSSWVMDALDEMDSQWREYGRGPNL